MTMRSILLLALTTFTLSGVVLATNAIELESVAGKSTTVSVCIDREDTAPETECVPLAAVEVAAELGRRGPAADGLVAPGEVPEGLSAGDWRAIQQRIEADKRAFRHDVASETWWATHVATGIEAAFDASGVVTVHGSASPEPVATVRLVQWGVPEAPQAAVEPTRVEVEEQRLAYHRPSLIEWYDNKDAGLMHGFTVAAPPCEDPQELGFTLAVATDFELRASADRQGAELRCPITGTLHYVYDGLKAWDATGKPLAATIDTDYATIELRVNVVDAAFPITVDPVWSETKWVASDGATPDQFGFSVAIDGDTAVVGARFAHVSGTNFQGAAYVFVRSGSTWSEQAKLTASDGERNDRFGESVALDGDTALVGAIGVEISGKDRQGAVYVYVRSGTSWSEEAKLIVSDGELADWFGYSVALEGDTALIGARMAEIGVNARQGAAYVFLRSGTSWSEEAKLTASDGDEEDNFGHSVALDGTSAIIGAPRANAAYEFVGSGSSWSEQAKLTPSDGVSGMYFGGSVAIDGDTAVIGAPQAPIGGNWFTGAAYVFLRSGTSWTEAEKLIASDSDPGGRFGDSVALDGNSIVIGAHEQEVGGNYWQGAAYVFLRAGDSWTETARLTAFDGDTEDHFGFAVAAEAGTALVGAYRADTDRGAVYQFVLRPTVSVVPAAAQADPTNSMPVEFDVYFAEDVTGFDETGVDLSASTTPGTLAASVSGSGNFYTVAVSGMTGDGDVVVSIVEDAAQSVASGLDSKASLSSATVAYDITQPTVTLFTPVNDPTNQSPFTVTATFSKDVSGFELTDVFVGNGSASNFNTVDDQTYTFDVTPASDGLVTIDVPAGVAEDAAGNGNEAASQLSRTYDSTPPEVTIMAVPGQDDPADVVPVAFEVTLSEPVVGMGAAAFDLSQSTAPGTSIVEIVPDPGSAPLATSFVVRVTASDFGDITLLMPADAVEDPAGNGNLASTGVPTITFAAPVFVMRDADTEEVLAHQGSHALAFPVVPTGHATVQLRLENNGVAPLELLGLPPVAVQVSGPAIAWVAEAPATSIAPSASSIAEITLVPQDAGAVELLIEVPSNDPQIGTYTVTLTATVSAVPRAVLVEPFGRAVGSGEPVTLADRLIGGPSTVAFELRNTGGAMLSQVLVELAPNEMENVTATLLSMAPTSIPPGESHPIEIELEPWARGTFRFELHVASDDPLQPTITVPVSGYGAASAQARIRIERLPGIAVGPTDELGVLSAAGHSETWSLRNIGTVATALQAVEVSDAVNVNATVTSEPGEIAIGEALPLTVEFAPQSEGALEAVLTLDFGSEATAPAPHTLAVLAEASAQPTPRLHLYAENGMQVTTGNPVPIGRFAPPESRSLRYVLHNAGTATLTLADEEPVAVTDATNAQVTLVSYPTMELAPGDTTEFRLTVAPDTAATFEATIALASNDPQADPFELVLLGEEPAGRLELRRPALVHREPGSTDTQLTLKRDQSYTLTYLAHNAGNAPLTLNPADTTAATRIDTTTGATATLIAPPSTDTVLQPGEQQELHLRFTPRAASYEIVLAVVSDDPVAPAYTITIQGNATETTGSCALHPTQERSVAALPLLLLLTLTLLLLSRRRIA